MRLLLGVFLIVHGIAHLVGFVVPWRLMTAPDLPYQTTILSGRVDVGDGGIRVVGIGWLLLAVAFIALGAALLAGLFSPSIVMGVAVASLIFCIVGLPDARIGLVLNGALLILLVGVSQFRWLSFTPR